mmetsp:Transcript_13471/g.22918  ORF Transcript_13471/g.22918 Transcript_13471/m.22918 type:complete len:224 (+) Transcript_13471:871-1542(+)
MEKIMHQESHHFIRSRLVYTGVCFFSLFITQYYDDTHYTWIKKKLPFWESELVFVLFALVMATLTKLSVSKVNRIHKVKQAEGYDYDPNDLRFDSVSDVLKLSFFCMIASILCGVSGIAGGMVLGPLFLQYNMIPQVMSGTNQYITMISSISVVTQFIMLKQLNFEYAKIFGVLTLVFAYVGIKGVNIYISRSGKQSVILISLTVVLIIALVSLPIKRVIEQA